MKTITRIKKIAAIIACVLVSIGVMICASSCFIFWGNADFKIDLPIGFSRQEKENYEAYYTSSNMTVSIEREFYQPDGYQKGLATVKEYAIEVEDRWKLSKGETSWSSEAIEEDGLTYFIYEDDELGENVIAAVFSKGYKLGDRIIREAVVQVANS